LISICVIFSKSSELVKIKHIQILDAQTQIYPDLSALLKFIVLKCGKRQHSRLLYIVVLMKCLLKLSE